MKNLLISMMFFLLAACSSNSNKLVEVNGRSLMVNGSAYIIKGVCYHPVNKGKATRSFKFIDKDIALMKEAGINTVRVYEPIDNMTVLDKFKEAGIKVIMGFGYNQAGKFDIKSGSFSDYIETYKDHPAILLWEFGNEYNYHPEWFDGDIKNWYKYLNNAAEIAQNIDPARPTATAHGELPDSITLSLCPNIAVWGLNVYRWDAPESIFKQWQLISDKPMYLSEAGADSYMTIANKGFEKGENEAAQAQATKNILDATFKNFSVCSGVTVFSFVDEFWKAGNYDQQDIGGWAPESTGVPYDGTPNEEFWGLVKIDRTPKMAFDVVKSSYLSK